MEQRQDMSVVISLRGWSSLFVNVCLRIDKDCLDRFVSNIFLELHLQREPAQRETNQKSFRDHRLTNIKQGCSGGRASCCCSSLYLYKFNT